MLRYNISSGVKKIKTKTAIIVSVVTLGLGGATFGLALPLAAHASSVGNGSDYCTQVGCATSLSHTQCAGAGAFDAFGKNASLGTEKVHATFLGSYPGPGTDGQQTAANNSNLCGNPQN
jgi:hypothetical protein